MGKKAETVARSNTDSGREEGSVEGRLTNYITAKPREKEEEHLIKPGLNMSEAKSVQSRNEQVTTEDATYSFSTSS